MADENPRRFQLLLFLRHQVFLSRISATGIGATIAQMYLNVLGRIPDPTGLAGWLATLDSGVSRGYVLLGLAKRWSFGTEPGFWGRSLAILPSADSAVGPY